MKRLLWALLLIPMIVTYGSIYADSQRVSCGWVSHNDNATDHLQAAAWALDPITWIAAPIVTDGYKNGFQFRHHHTRFCLTVADFTNQESNRCELDPECDPVYRMPTPCPDREKLAVAAQKEKP